MSAPTTERSASESEKKLNYSEKIDNVQTHKIELLWPMVIIQTFLHTAAAYGFYLVLTSSPKIATILYAIFLYQIAMWGTTAGAHRLWSHRAYKAKWPLRLLLMIMFSTSYQYSVIHWSRDHRVHHKYGDTNADPYNPKRGFIFSQMGWTVLKKHPDVAKKGKEIDLSDLYDDPIIRFQHNYVGTVLLICCFIVPTLVPMYFWNETLANAFFVAVALRWTITVHIVGLVNSVAHMFGMKPYDKNMSAVETLPTAILTSGEGWHNFHHVFPWDYKTSELGKYWTNSTTAFIDFFAWIGWAYDLKTVSDNVIQKRIARTGDGTHPVWGWHDKDMTKEDIADATKLFSCGNSFSFTGESPFL